MAFEEYMSKLEKFVIETVGHRSASHSDEHMRVVVNNSRKIYEHTYGEEMLENPMYLLTATVAWLHDVADHKYLCHDPSLKQKVADFLDKFTEDYKHLVKGSDVEYLYTTEKIQAIIDRISYSKEKKNGDNDWNGILGDMGIKIRNIVSDADKIEAIGKVGIQRCVRYAAEKLEQENIEATKERVFDHVFAHYNDKLKHLSSKYMRTEFGKKWAATLDEEMVAELENMRNELKVM